ncbi:MAG: hypothetical protein IAF38_06580 [Bacteroidia bacterium]|nr:hypothetical protein [Bacteroidia bacterium]
MKTNNYFLFNVLIHCLLFLSALEAQEKEKKHHYPILGHTTSIAAGNIFSSYNYANFEIGRTYCIPIYKTDPVDVLHSFTLGIGTEINTQRGYTNFYKVFLDYDLAMFTYVHRSFKLKFDFIEDQQRKNCFFRPSIGISRHIHLGKLNIDTKVEILYGYTFKFQNETSIPRNCLMLRLKHNFNYVKRFSRFYSSYCG